MSLPSPSRKHVEQSDHIVFLFSSCQNGFLKGKYDVKRWKMAETVIFLLFKKVLFIGSPQLKDKN